MADLLNRGVIYDESYVEDEEVIKPLVSMGYEYKHEIKTIKSLYENIWVQLARINGFKLDEEDKKDIIKNVFESSIGIEGKVGIWQSRYSIERPDGTKVHIKFLADKREDNVLQIINQLEIPGLNHDNRYDVNILVNGIPLVHIELKKKGKKYPKGLSSMDELFSQIKRYRSNSYPNTIMEFTRLFVISDSVITKYFANNLKQFEDKFGGGQEEVGLKYTRPVTWGTDDNVQCNLLSDFIPLFFEPGRLYSLLMDYFIVGTQGYLVMRPYQVYALERVVELVKNRNPQYNEKEVGLAYLFHATGSGKTLTTFKLAQKLSTLDSSKKVIFLVDRRDLNDQTADEFTKFNKGNPIGKSKHTSELIEQLKDGEKFIITTIQKFNNVVKQKDTSYLNKYNDVLFIFDECHRTVFGDMLKNIKKVLHSKNCRVGLIGVTGTPIYPENSDSDAKTTAEIFGPEIHKYLMANAQADGNILAFDIHPCHKFLEGAATEEDRKTRIVNMILQSYAKHTSNTQFNAMLAVESKLDLLEYYKLLKSVKHNLKIAAIFTAENEIDDLATDDESLDRESKNAGLKSIIDDYNNLFSTNFGMETKEDYYTDVQKRVRNKEIDLIIVVDMLLTGFDSKKLSTIYLDKNLITHRLIQAMSRVNRVYGNSEIKPYGNVVCFRDLRKAIDEALALFNKGTKQGLVAEPVEDRIKRLQIAIDELLGSFPTIKDVLGLKPYEKVRKVEFIELFLKVVRAYNAVAFVLNFETDIVGFTEKNYLEYTSAFHSINRKGARDTGGKTDNDGGVVTDKDGFVPDVFDFDLERVGTYRADVDYILKTIISLILKVDTTQEELDSVELMIKASALSITNQEVLLDIVYKTISIQDKTISEQIRNDFLKDIKEKGIETTFNEKRKEKGVENLKLFAERWSIPFEQLWLLYENFELTKVIRGSALNELLLTYNVDAIIEDATIGEKLKIDLLELFQDMTNKI